MAGNGLEVRRLSGSIGAEILGIDLASESGDNVIGQIRQVWLEHNVGAIEAGRNPRFLTASCGRRSQSNTSDPHCDEHVTGSRATRARR